MPDELIGFANSLVNPDVIHQHGLGKRLRAIGRLVTATERSTHGDVENQVKRSKELLHRLWIDGLREINEAVDASDDFVLVPFGFEQMKIIAQRAVEGLVLTVVDPTVGMGARLRRLYRVVAPMHREMRRPLVGVIVVHFHEIDFT
jgi:hypothetical protein